MARPKGTTKLEIDPTVGQRILTYLRTGSYLETAAEAVGLDASTIHRWLARGAKGQEPFSTFAADVRRATAEAELRDLARIDRAADESWQAAAWKMERRNPKAWGRREYTEVTGADGGPIRYEQLEEPELDAEIKRLADELEATAGNSDE